MKISNQKITLIMAVFAIICAAGSWQWNIFTMLGSNQMADIFIVILSLTATAIGLATVVMERGLSLATILGIAAMATATPLWLFIVYALLNPGVFVSH